MAVQIPDLAALRALDFDTIIDVRSPSEYAEDHVPGAINLPVLSDAERAEVGTIYVQESAFRARKIGAALVARNAARHIEGPLAHHDGGWRPLVYCWRGGQRSGSFAGILSQIGWRVDLVAGGYQSYRRAVKAALYDRPFPSRVVLVDGNTGTAKTDILAALRARGRQVIDLEGLARHRGSVFGGTGADQPEQKGFESALAGEVAALDPARPVFVEAESSKVGARIVPPALWAEMRRAPRVEISAPLEARAEYLTRAYADLIAAPGRTEEIIAGLKRLQGADTVERWTGLLREGAFQTLAAELMERHYDPRYAKQRGRGEGDFLGTLKTEGLQPDDVERIADRLDAMVPDRQAAE